MSMPLRSRPAVLLGICGALLLSSTACRVGGGNPASSPVATSPRGATLAIDWRESSAGVVPLRCRPGLRPVPLLLPCALRR